MPYVLRRTDTKQFVLLKMPEKWALDTVPDPLDATILSGFVETNDLYECVSLLALAAEDPTILTRFASFRPDLRQEAE